MRQSVIIVAGGKGIRMGKEIPKQFIPIGGLPVLMWTIQKFNEFNPEIQIILVLPENQHEYWLSLCKKYNFNIVHEITHGGETRFHSVQNGLSLLKEEGWVAIHDGVRPFVSVSTIAQCFEAAKKYGAVVPALPCVESIRKVKENGLSISCSREDYWLVQTPQIFRVGWLQNSYTQLWSNKFTDDASVVEAAGYSIYMVEGNKENIKITSPIDLLIGEHLLKTNTIK